MKQAGDGADFVEGQEGARDRRCFKCGAMGHFAGSCPGVAGEVRPCHPTAVCGLQAGARVCTRGPGARCCIYVCRAIVRQRASLG